MSAVGINDAGQIVGNGDIPVEVPMARAIFRGIS